MAMACCAHGEGMPLKWLATTLINSSAFLKSLA